MGGGCCLWKYCKTKCGGVARGAGDFTEDLKRGCLELCVTGNNWQHGWRKTIVLLVTVCGIHTVDVDWCVAGGC